MHPRLRRGCLSRESNMSATPNTFLSVNNIEVIYNHVILVLKGVSFSVPEGSIVALWAVTVPVKRLP